MKKIVTLLSLVLIFTVSSSLLFSCKHEHVYGEWKTVKVATCTEDGLYTRICKCGEQSTKDIPATGHTDGKWIIDTNATCTQNGKKHQICSVCSQIIDTEIIAATGHEFGSWNVDVSATCVKDGVKSRRCSICKTSTQIESFPLPTSTATDIYNAANKSVGEITTYDKYGDEYALGTGFVYKSDGQIITNYHVIEDAISATITFGTKTYNIESVLAYDKTVDLAILKINASNLPVLKICTKEHKVGTVVYALGSSKGLTNTFSEGIITYSNRVIDKVSYVQHDAAISNGNSGGPLINQYNEIIGINTLAIKDSQNLNFAISTREISSLELCDPISLKDLFGEKEDDTHSSISYFEKMKNYIVNFGTYSSYNQEYTITLGYSYSDDYSSKYTRKAVYKIADDSIRLEFLINDSNCFGILLPGTEGIFAWAYADNYGYAMGGFVIANYFNSNTILEEYQTNIYDYSLKLATKKLASAMLKMLLLYFDTDFSSAGVDVCDLGFYYF